MYVEIRRYTDADDLAEAMWHRDKEVRELIEGVPGFVAYYAARDGDHVATITVCEDQAGTQESTRRTRDWVRRTLPNITIGAPEVIEGGTFIEF